MEARTKLFSCKDIYDLEGTSALFTQAVRENVLHHQKGCEFYRDLLSVSKFDPSCIQTEQDCAALPSIPATFFKYHQVNSIPLEESNLYATSSGTRGQKSQMHFDKDTLDTGVRMVVNCFKWHGLISLLPTNYVMLGYEPTDENEMGAVKTAMGVTRFAPAKERVFTLRSIGGSYEVDKFGVLSALKRFEKQHLPVRLVGFPSYLYFLLKTLKQESIALSLNKNSLVLLGGGWKQFDDQTIGKQELYALAEERLGIKSTNCRDFYSALEHSIAYAECSRHHFHVPIWSRVIIRDIKTLQPVGYDTPGFLSFVTPLVQSAPLVSVTMGDIAILRSGCGCGIESPYFEVLGRAGRMRNCAVAASEWMGAK